MKTKTQLVMERTQEPAAPVVVELRGGNATATAIEALQGEIAAIRAADDAKIAEKQAEIQRLAAVRQPLNEMHSERTELLRRIAAGERQRLVQEGRARLYREAIDAYILRDSLDSFADHGPAVQSLQHGERLAVEAARWVAARRAELPELEKRIRAYAVAHGLEHGLSAEKVA